MHSCVEQGEVSVQTVDQAGDLGGEGLRRQPFPQCLRPFDLCPRELEVGLPFRRRQGHGLHRPAARRGILLASYERKHRPQPLKEGIAGGGKADPHVQEVLARGEVSTYHGHPAEEPGYGQSRAQFCFDGRQVLSRPHQLLSKAGQVLLLRSGQQVSLRHCLHAVQMAAQGAQMLGYTDVLHVAEHGQAGDSEHDGETNCQSPGSSRHWIQPHSARCLCETSGPEENARPREKYIIRRWRPQRMGAPPRTVQRSPHRCGIPDQRRRPRPALERPSPCSSLSGNTLVARTVSGTSQSAKPDLRLVSRESGWYNISRQTR